MKNQQGKTSASATNENEAVAIERELKSLNQSISVLQDSLSHSKNGNGLSTEDLMRLAKTDEQEEFVGSKKNIAERIDNSKGFFKFWVVKVPARNLNIASLTQNQQSINDSIRALSSPICPICANGILMYNKRAIPNEQGNVKWFCSNHKDCTFTIFAEPSLLKISAAVNNSNIREVGRLRWEALTVEEKDELIESHFFKAILYRSFAICLIVFLLIMAYMHFIWGMCITIMCLAYVALGSLRWCYRAWQIKTGNVYLESSPFIHWLKTAEKYYSLDWVDQECSEDDSEPGPSITKE